MCIRIYTPLVASPQGNQATLFLHRTRPLRPMRRFRGKSRRFQNSGGPNLPFGSVFTVFHDLTRSCSWARTCRREWITKFASGGPKWVKGCDPAMPPREHDRDALFNVYEV